MKTLTGISSLLPSRPSPLLSVAIFRLSRLSGVVASLVCTLILVLGTTPSRGAAQQSPADSGVKIPLPADAREVPRRILVLFGWDEKESEKPQTWPVDTMAGEFFQAPLEWLGYEVEYHDIGKGMPPTLSSGRYAGILCDSKLEVPALQESGLAEWLIGAKNLSIPLLFTGGFPFSNDEVMYRMRAVFGIRGKSLPVSAARHLSVVKVDKVIMDSETPVTVRQTEYRDLQAPEDARVFLSLEGEDAEGSKVTYDPVYLTRWGGMWLEPYIILRASADCHLFYADPYKMLAAWLAPHGVFPAPDTSTRDGRRIFYSHIDGDGFASNAQFKGHPICGEIIRDRILKAFPLPITVSVVEADIKGLPVGLKTEDAEKFRQIARSLFALPNVQVASHTFSHPYMWEPKDDNPGIYDEPNLPLKPEASYPTIDIEREIRGSIHFINSELLPPGKKCEILLWSGNCRPGPAAIRMVREMGLENMNGGNTIISRLYPGIAGVAPRTMWWDGELQVHASNQNEFMYANGFNGPFYSGFADVIDTFERTETPRRLKPVNIYYHFYSATYLSSLRAVEKIHQWAMNEKLHSLTALQFIQLTKDSLQTRVFELGPRHWLLANEGLQRTFRLPAYLGKPDLAQCKGVTGYTIHEGQMFIHTQGKSQTELVLKDAAAAGLPHAYLAESSAEIEWKQFSPDRLDFKAEDLRPVEVVIGGLPAHGICDLAINGVPSQAAASAGGFLTLELPARSSVTLGVTPARHVFAR